MNKRITEISATNLKGLSFSHKLNKVTVFFGSNESGKTARMDAILLAQLGYKLKPGRLPLKTSAAIFRSCGCRGGGATELVVANTMSDGQMIRRSWTMRRGSIKYDGPDQEFIPTTMLDPTGFFAMTGPARLNYVLSQVDLAEMGLGYETLCKKLVSEIVINNQSPDAAVAATSELSIEIKKLEAVRRIEASSIYDWLTKVVESITALRDTESKLVDTHTESLRAQTDNKAQDADMSACQSVQPEINEARARHTAAVAAEATALSELMATERRAQEAKTLAATAVDETAVLQTIAVQEARIELARQVPVADERPAAKAMSLERPNAVGETATLRSIEAAANTSSRRVESNKSNVTNIERQIAAAKEHALTCPSCGHQWHQDASFVPSLTADLQVAKSTLAKSELDNAHNQQAAKLAENSWHAACRLIDQWDATKLDLDKENESERRQWQAVQDTYTTAQTAINTSNGDIQRLRQQIAGNQAAKTAWEQLPAFEAVSKCAGDAYTAAKSAVSPIAEQIRQLETRQRQYIARTQDNRRADQSRELLKTATERHTVFKAALKVVAGEKERAASEAFNSLLKHARLMTDGNLRAPLEFRDGELGMVSDGQWVEIGEFCGKEARFALAGLGLALTQKSSPRIILMDEMGVLDAASKLQMIQRAAQLIEQGVLDQFVGADVSAHDYPAQSTHFSLIRIDKAG